MKKAIFILALVVLAIGLSGCTEQPPPGGQVLLEKPLEEYALTLQDVDAGFKEYAEYKKYHTLDEIDVESEEYQLLVTNGFQNAYSIGFYKGENPLHSDSSLIKHDLYKFDKVEGANQHFAVVRANSEKTTQEYEDTKELLITPFSGDEIFASKSELPSGSNLYFAIIRTKNVYHEIIILDRMGIFSDQIFSNYINKIVEKTQ